MPPVRRGVARATWRRKIARARAILSKYLSFTSPNHPFDILTFM